MNHEKVRGILALLVVGGFVVIMGILAVIPSITQTVSPTVMMEYLRSVGSIFGGMVGLIVGWYFGKSAATPK